MSGKSIDLKRTILCGKETTKAMLKGCTCKDCFNLGCKLGEEYYTCTHHKIYRLINPKECFCKYKYFLSRSHDPELLKQYEESMKELYG